MPSEQGVLTYSKSLNKQWDNEAVKEKVAPVPEDDVRSNDDFLHRPEQQWAEPAFEQTITYVGNVRNYYYAGEGKQNLGQDLTMLKENSKEDVKTQTPLDLEEALKGRGDSNPEVSYNPKKLVCMCCHELDPSQSTPDGTLYGELPPGDTFRVLELLPGHGGDRVSTRLHVACLSQTNVVWEALSYVWGDVSETVPITCNGQQFQVGKNLSGALHGLRSATKSRIIWADALCINQSDISERSQQVQRMGSIFRKALRVIVWLGHGKFSKERLPPFWTIHWADPEAAFAGVCMVVNSWYRSRGGFDSGGKAMCWFSREGQYESRTADHPLPSSSPLWNHIFDLYRRPWFSRLWIIQEAALAKSVLFYWGDWVISWEYVGLAAAIVRNNFYRIVGETGDPVKGPNVIPEKPKISGRLMTLPTGILNAYFLYRISESQKYSHPLRLSFYQLLSLTRQFECKDPRDRVYGLLGLHTTDQDDTATQFIEVDYNKSPGEVYHEVALKVLSTADSLSLLSSIQHASPAKFFTPFKEGRRKSFPAPSWTPQWHVVLTRTLTPTEPDESFDPGLGRPMQVQVSEDGKILSVLGIDIEPVTLIEDFHFDSFWRGQDHTRAPRWMSWNQQESESNDAEEKEDPLDSLLRKYQITLEKLRSFALTLTAGKNWYGFPVKGSELDLHVADYAKCLLKRGLHWSLTRLSVRDDDPYQPSTLSAYNDKFTPFGNYWPLSFGPPASIIPPSNPILAQPEPETGTYLTKSDLEEIASALDGHADRFLDAVATACEERNSFVTAYSGMHGIGPQNIKKGDRLCVLYGAKVPFILRKRETMRKKQAETSFRHQTASRRWYWPSSTVNGVAESVNVVESDEISNLESRSSGAKDTRKVEGNDWTLGWGNSNQDTEHQNPVSGDSLEHWLSLGNDTPDKEDKDKRLVFAEDLAAASQSDPKLDTETKDSEKLICDHTHKNDHRDLRSPGAAGSNTLEDDESTSSQDSIGHERTHSERESKTSSRDDKSLYRCRYDDSDHDENQNNDDEDDDNDDEDDDNDDEDDDNDDEDDDNDDEDDDNDDEDDPGYELIGECYVHDLMRGEAVSEIEAGYGLGGVREGEGPGGRKAEEKLFVIH